MLAPQERGRFTLRVRPFHATYPFPLCQMHREALPTPRRVHGDLAILLIRIVKKLFADVRTGSSNKGQVTYLENRYLLSSCPWNYTRAAQAVRHVPPLADGSDGLLGLNATGEGAALFGALFEGKKGIKANKRHRGRVAEAVVSKGRDNKRRTFSISGRSASKV